MTRLHIKYSGKKKMDEWILETHAISKTYGGVRAVDKVSLKIKKGSITALIGPNGSGKTTLFNLISGVDKPDSGKIFFSGVETIGLPPYKLFQMGLLRTFQNPRLFFGMSVLENTILPVKNKGENPVNALFPSKWYREELGVAEKAKDILDSFNLSQLCSKSASEISGGQIKLLQLAMVFITESQLVL
ncbi:MAG: ATP-binding cassette domain-containing protein, partial [Thermoprotei archaeon]